MLCNNSPCFYYHPADLPPYHVSFFFSRRPPTLLGRAVWLTVRLTFWGAVVYAVYRAAPVPRKHAWVAGLSSGVVTSAVNVRDAVVRRFTS